MEIAIHDAAMHIEDGLFTSPVVLESTQQQHCRNGLFQVTDIWMMWIESTLDAEDSITTVEPNSERSISFCDVLHDRLTKHSSLRLDDECKREHWCWAFFVKTCQGFVKFHCHLITLKKIHCV